MYNHIYQLTHDMDCFFVMNGYSVHIATNGGIVPSKLGTVEELQTMQTQVANLERKFGYNLNTNYLSTLDKDDFPTQEELNGLDVELPLYDRLFDNDNYRSIPFHWKVYSQSFVEMAMKGFWSFDRIGEMPDGGDYYVLVACPSDGNPENKPKVGKFFVSEELGGWFDRRLPLYSLPLMEVVEKAAALKKEGE